MHILQNESGREVFTSFQAVYSLIYGDFQRFENLYYKANNDILFWVFFLIITLLSILVFINFTIGKSVLLYQECIRDSSFKTLYNKLIYCNQIEKSMSHLVKEKINSDIKSYLSVISKDEHESIDSNLVQNIITYIKLL